MATLEQIAQAQTEFLGELETDIGTALTALGTLANREYGYTHTAVVTDDLETDYQAIITSNPELAYVCAVGMLAILKDGDTVTAQGNRLFINGSEESGDYSFSGTNSQNGIEVVKIWYFNTTTLTLVKPDFHVIAANTKEINGTVNLSNDFYDYCDEVIYTGALDGNRLGIKKQKNLAGGDFNDNLSSQLFEYESNCTAIPGNKGLMNLSYLKKAKFPYLTTISTIASTANGFVNCVNLTELEFPNLTTINDLTAGSAVDRSVFYNVPTVVIPESVMYLGRYAFMLNNSVVLNCKNATTIHDDAFVDVPTNFTMCSDWGVSVNIKKGAGNWIMADFIDLLNNKLRDMTLTNETRTLTIPSAMLTSLQADTDGAAAIAAATAKGWTIGGA
ncbi:MAG: hypothetical protein IJU45_09760 [Clostridia bacterium]|nr:hypothetical protein [Clostridia bacterium]